MLSVNPKSQSLSLSLSKEELDGLMQNIVATHGPRDPIVIWNNTIVDGHQRYAICQKPLETDAL